MAAEIVLGYDGSAGARAALDQAARLAKALDTGVVVVFGYAAIRVGGETQDQEQIVGQLGRSETDEAVEVLKGRGIDATAELIHDRPDAAILAAAEACDAPLIIVGATGVGPIAGAVLGSVTYKLVHRSSRPVLVVPAGD